MDDNRPVPGTPVARLDTPCLLVDLDALENNLGMAAKAYSATPCKMRQHVKNVKSPLIARMQMRAGGTVGGVCAAKVSEAEVMVEGGIGDVLVPNQVVTRDKIARLCELARRGDVKVCVDDAGNVRELSEIAVAQGVSIGVLIEVDTSMGRAGVRSADHGVELAKLAQELPGVEFRGVMSHQHLEEFTDQESRGMTALRYLRVCMDVRDAIEAAGVPVDVVSSGETFSYDVFATVPGVTEVEGGTYALMCTDYTYMEGLRIANKVLGTVVSTPRPGVAIGDVGLRAIAPCGAWPPSVEGMPGVEVERLFDEHVVLRTNGTTTLGTGDRFVLLPGYQDMMVNRWDRYVAVRNGLVEEVWDVSARGCFH